MSLEGFFNLSVLMCSHKFTLEFQAQRMQRSLQVGITGDGCLVWDIVKRFETLVLVVNPCL